MNAMRIMASHVEPKLMIATAAGSYAWFVPSSDRYGPNAGRARNVAIVNSPMTIASVRNAPLRQGDSQVRQDHLDQDPRPSGAEALGRLGQASDVDGLEPGVHRAVHVRERQDDVRRGEKDVAAHVRRRQAGRARR